MREYCAEVKGPTVELLGALFDLQTDASQGQRVVELVDTLLRAEAIRPSAEGAAQLAWDRHARATLGEIRDAAQAGDGVRAWVAFSAQGSGLHLLGKACQGQPGW
ncbi:hypothetical protein [Demequina subtropica]|uniref:hypothetical protein n=1 Tax=Demequina subtropica TaxID=1638989 RepID=UPI000781B691|nr:hypothetical protein [Demequina subtropica]